MATLKHLSASPKSRSPRMAVWMGGAAFFLAFNAFLLVLRPRLRHVPPLLPRVAAWPHEQVDLKSLTWCKDQNPDTRGGGPAFFLFVTFEQRVATQLVYVAQKLAAQKVWAGVVNLNTAYASSRSDSVLPGNRPECVNQSHILSKNVTPEHTNALGLILFNNFKKIDNKIFDFNILEANETEFMPSNYFVLLDEERNMRGLFSVQKKEVFDEIFHRTLQLHVQSQPL